MDLELADRSAVVTGGSKGIGLACARGLALEGVRVGITSRNSDNLEAAKSSLARDGISVVTVQADLTEAEQAIRMADQMQSALGPIDILINSAGAARRKRAEDMSAIDWHAGMDSKYFTYIHAIESLVHGMAERRHGAIVNVTGAGGKLASPVHLAGGAANAALNLATAGLARAYAPYGVRVNAVSPGYTRTERLEHTVATEAERLGVSPSEALEEIVAKTPLGRIAQADEIADVVVFLSSPRAGYVSGAIVMADGATTPTVV